jgi:hypothetical protein
MKKIAVLACGPSLPKLWTPIQRNAYDLVIGVNTAGWLFSVDWLAFTDTHIIPPIKKGEYPQPRIGYITNTGQAVPPDRERILLPLYHRGLGNLTPVLRDLAESQGMTECGYTFPNALHQAQLWAEGGQIDVFGFDCAMVRTDAAGQEGYHTRKRWMTELPWIKSQWGTNVRAISYAHATILAWLAGTVAWEEVQALFPACAPGLEGVIPGVGEPLCKIE